MLLESYFEARPEGAPPPPAQALLRAGVCLECPETRERVFLLPDGRLLPCPGFAGTKVASRMPTLRDWSLTDALADSPLARFCRDEKSARLSLNPECAACDQFRDCGMGCRAYALTEGGGINKPDPGACAMYKGGWKRRFTEAERLFTGKEGLL
jgi:radical SAM protein with 4Fe4S-binding SPASM domain